MSDTASAKADVLILGKRVRYFRLAAELTLKELSSRAGIATSQLSLIENGHREPRLSLLQTIASELNIQVTDLLSGSAPDRRSALEIALDRAQRGAAYAKLGLPTVRSTKALPTEALEALVGLHGEIERRETQAIATPEEARRANTELRGIMREHNNYLPEIEALAEERVKASGHESGALTHREVDIMAKQLGLRVIHVNDLPHSVRSVTDTENGRIYIPPASIPGGHGLRSMALQAMAHRLLGHKRPTSYADFLHQRLEINYFAACCLIPQSAAVKFLQDAKQQRNLAVEDFRDAFGVTHENAGMRLTNLATVHLDIPLHFLRVSDRGTISKAYENDGLSLPTDGTGAVEGQFVCRQWAARNAFRRTNRTTEHYQYTDTPSGTFWCATQTGTTQAGEFSITVGVPFDSSKWFRGRGTPARASSTCPDPACCQRPPQSLSERWSAKAWPSAKLHAHIFSPLPSGSFPGVDDTEVFEFLEHHAAKAES